METTPPQNELGIEFVSALPLEMRDALEALFFFNPRQSVVRNGIRASVEQSGPPEIVQQDGRLWLGVPSGAFQCLFACGRQGDQKRLLGVVLYGRVSPETLAVTHLAVDPAYAFGGDHIGQGLGLLLIEQVRQIARRIKGVRQLQLPYRRDCRLPL